MPPLAPSSSAQEVLSHLRTLGSEENRQDMLRYGIRIDRALGIPRGVQRDVAKRIGRDHARAFELWATGIPEARLIASITVDPEKFTVQDARHWVADLDSWDIVDGVSDLFAGMPQWKDLVREFAADDREFVRRTAFAMIAWAVAFRKTEAEETFTGFLELIETLARDDRNFVKKAVNWALRSIGKRSITLNAQARETAARLAATDDRTARWIGKDALRELSAPATLERITTRAARKSAR